MRLEDLLKQFNTADKIWQAPTDLGEWGALMQASLRRVYLFSRIAEEDVGEIEDGLGISALVRAFHTLDDMGHDPITLYINSPGGSIASGLALIGVMRSLESEVHTIVVGQAASMAAVVALAGARRLAFPTARWLLHRGKSATQGDAEDIAIEAKELSVIDSYADQVIVNCTKIKHEELGKMQRKNFWLGANSALKYGLIDEILVPRQATDWTWIPPKRPKPIQHEDEEGESVDATKS